MSELALDKSLLAAQHARKDLVLTTEINQRLDVLLSSADVSDSARRELSAILKHYATTPNPYRTCVADNLEKFGPGKTEKVCATIKDMIRGTTRWRSFDDGVFASEISEEMEELLLSIPDDALEKIVMEASHA